MAEPRKERMGAPGNQGWQYKYIEIHVITSSPDDAHMSCVYFM